MQTDNNTPDRPVLDRDQNDQIAAAKASGLLNFRAKSLPIWCPGCGYFGITNAVNLALHDLGILPHDLVLVSGIGCSGRYPYFTKCYGFHTIHGRPLPIASGIKMANNDLTVLAVGGDGDGLAIGIGHLPHTIRRNVDITYILFDNGIYGLTKGQTSPTTPHGQVTKVHPYGNPDSPLNPMLIALSYGVTFAAKGYAGMQDNLTVILRKAIKHRGFSFVHVVSPCVTFDHENILYDRLRNIWLPVPNEHQVTDRAAAINLAMQDTYMHGVFFDNAQPSWDQINSEKIKALG